MATRRREAQLGRGALSQLYPNNRAEQQSKGNALGILAARNVARWRCLSDDISHGVDQVARLHVRQRGFEQPVQRSEGGITGRQVSQQAKQLLKVWEGDNSGSHVAVEGQGAADEISPAGRGCTFKEVMMSRRSVWLVLRRCLHWLRRGSNGSKRYQGVPCCGPQRLLGCEPACMECKSRRFRVRSFTSALGVNGLLTTADDPQHAESASRSGH